MADADSWWKIVMQFVNASAVLAGHRNGPVRHFSDKPPYVQMSSTLDKPGQLVVRGFMPYGWYPS